MPSTELVVDVHHHYMLAVPAAGQHMRDARGRAAGAVDDDLGGGMGD